jgi:hypothetical protein
VRIAAHQPFLIARFESKLRILAFAHTGAQSSEAIRAPARNRSGFFEHEQECEKAKENMD